jgi:hypothetical protein
LVCFLVADYFLIVMVNSAFDIIWIKLLNVVFALAQLFSYLLVAVSNPGIELAENVPFEDTQEGEND